MKKYVNIKGKKYLLHIDFSFNSMVIHIYLNPRKGELAKVIYNGREYVNDIFVLTENYSSFNEALTDFTNKVEIVKYVNFLSDIKSINKELLIRL